MIYEIMFWKKMLLKYHGMSIYAHVQWNIYDILWYKVFWYRSNFALSQTMFQWAPPMEIIRWYSMDPASGGCALVFVDPASGGCELVFCGPRQWGLNIGHSQGCWVTSVLNRIESNLWLYYVWIFENIGFALNQHEIYFYVICSIVLENYIISELSSWDICYLLGCLAHYLSFYFFRFR